MHWSTPCIFHLSAVLEKHSFTERLWSYEVGISNLHVIWLLACKVPTRCPQGRDEVLSDSPGKARGARHQGGVFTC